MGGQKSKEAVSTSGMGAISGTVTSPGTSESQKSLSQSYLLIWADSSSDEKKQDCQNTLRHLRSVVNEVHQLTTPAQCISVLKEMNKRKAFVISSGALGRELVPEIHDIQLVDTIYIFCANKQRHEEWAKHWSKIQGVYTEIKPICELLKKVTRELDHDAISMSIVPKQVVASDGEKQDLDQLEPSFMYTVLFKEIILEIDEDNSKAMKQLVDYCRETGTNENELKDFESRYRHQKSPIWWYTREIFLYGMLNQALRSLEMETMVKLGFVIRNLHQQLAQLHKEQLNDFKKKFVVYRGQGFNKEDFQRLDNNKGGLISFNSFLSTSKLPKICMGFIERNLMKNPENLGVLFIMAIDSKKVSISSRTPFARIDHESAVPTEEEILFSMHTVFRIETIQQMDKTPIYEVQLTLTDDNDPQLTGLTQQMREELKGSGWHRMGELMLRVGDFNGAEQLYIELLKNTDNERTKAVYYNQLGWAKKDQGEYKEAVKYYEKSIEIKERTLSKNHPDLATYYNNIALVYNNMGEYSKALEYYEKDIEITKIALPKNHPDLATSYNNIALVYKNMSEYSKALEYYEKSHKICEMALPKNLPNLAISYNNIALVYNDMGEYSKALEYYERSIEIRKITLPKNHPELAISYNNIASVYYNMKKYSKALELFERALEIQRQKLPPAHPHIANTKEWIELVKQKQ